MLPRVILWTPIRNPKAPSIPANGDLQLIAAINGGDSRAFEALYLRYRDWVTTLAYRFTGDND